MSARSNERITNYCRQFMNTGKCNKGDATGFGRCQFLHIAPGEMSKPATKGLETRTCFDFINKGRCQFGDDCRFRHPKPGEPVAKADRVGKRHRSEFDAARAWAAAAAEKEAKRKNGGGQGGASASASQHVIEGKSTRPALTLPACIAKVQPVVGPQPQPQPQPQPKSADPLPGPVAREAAAGEEEDTNPKSSSSGGGLLGLGDYDSSSGDEQT